MIRPVFALTAVLLLPLPALAQPVMRGDATVAVTLSWGEQTTLAGHLSDGAVVAALAVPCVRERTRRCVQDEAIRVGVALGTAEAVKRLVPRWRPDESDRKSFFSMHTALAFSAASRDPYALAVAATAGYLRIAAKKHWLSDVLVGAAVGAAIAGQVR